MGRRRRSSTADDLMDLVALLPWWGSVALAAVLYWVLHAVAPQPPPTAQTAKQLSEALPSMLWQGFATVGQYLIPFICLLGALASFMRRRKRKALFATASQAPCADALQGMSWREFEMLVSEGFKRRGYGVRETGGGVNLVLTKDGENFLVQCKQEKAAGHIHRAVAGPEKSKQGMLCLELCGKRLDLLSLGRLLSQPQFRADRLRWSERSSRLRLPHKFGVEIVMIHR